jgi:very-short-patch-repair endonuclease
MAAVLAGGPVAVLSHTSALHLWRLLRGAAPRPIHVTVPGGNRRLKQDGIVFHRSRRLTESERTAVDGIPTTTLERALVDAAGLLGSREIEDAVATAEREGLINADQLATLPDRYPRRAGMAMLRKLIQEPKARHFTRSEAERRCLQLLQAGGLPRPHSNVPVGPYELDLFWPEAGVAIEIDGYAYHSSRTRFEGDRRKDAWLRARGIEVIRLTWRQITRDATATAVLVGQALALARAERRDGRPGS